MTRNVDAALVYQRTEAGEDLLRAGATALGNVARRILPMIDGRRPVAQLPDEMRPGDLEAAITELQTQGLIRFTGRADSLGEEQIRAQMIADRASLQKLKIELDGLFTLEMGNPGEVWDARVRDSVSLTVLRSVLREGIDVAYFRSGSSVARRLVDKVRPIFRQHKNGAPD